METYIDNAYIKENIRSINTLKFTQEIYIKSTAIYDVCEILKTQYNFQMLVDLFALDIPQEEERFHIIYQLLSLTSCKRIFLKISLKNHEMVKSISKIYSSANWLEREVWDMYGVCFTNHPDMRRILTDYGFHHHPMRKDFPLTGFEEVRYDPIDQKVIHQKTSLAQEFRQFDFQSPWGGSLNLLPGDEKATK